MTAILSARGLRRHFGGVRAVDGVDLDIHAGEIHALIGPNGAGKTTLVSLLAGRSFPDSGRITFDGRDITRRPAHARVRDGIAYTFQITSVFPSLSVADNVALAVEGAGRGGQPQPALTAMGLGDRGDARAGSLSYGHQRLLEIAMGLAMAPRLLILDEPAQGLSSGEVEAFKVRIRSLLPDVAILMIEHNMDLVMDLAQRVTVLAAGRVIASGTPGEVRASAAVQEAYLGA